MCLVQVNRINKTCKAFILTVGEGNERIFSSGKFSHYLSFVRSLVISASKKGKFLERAEIHAPLIPLPASVRSFESPNNLASWSFSQADS
jgi:hypothetical protein